MASGVGVVAISLGAAFAFALSSTLKHVSAGEVPDAQGMQADALGRFVKATLAHPLWLGAIVTDGIGLALQVTALHLGALAVVQPLLISGLLFALLLRHHTGHRLSRADVGWAIVVVVSLAGFVLLANSGVQPHHQAVDRVPATLAAICGLAFAFGFLESGRRQRSEGRSAALMGIGLGTIYAATAALLKAVSDIAVRGIGPLATSWQLYVLLVLGALGLFLNQLVFQAGPLKASLPAIATVDPLLSIVVGVWIYDEHIRTGPAAGIGLLVLLAILGIAVIQLARLNAGDETRERVTAERESG